VTREEPKAVIDRHAVEFAFWITRLQVPDVCPSIVSVNCKCIYLTKKIQSIKVTTCRG
jgi:hypothetical protein